MPAKERHSLSDVDVLLKEGTCSVCGRVKVVNHWQGIWRCERKNNERKRIQRAGNPKRIRERKWRLRNVISLATDLPLTFEEFAAKFEEQGRCCAACKRTKRGRYEWSADHDHETGFFRGVLCRPCNTALGQFERAGRPDYGAYLASHMLTRVKMKVNAGAGFFEALAEVI